MMHITTLPHARHFFAANSRGPTARGRSSIHSPFRGPLAPGYCLPYATIVAACLLAAFLVLPGCKTNSTATPDAAAAKPARSEVQRGPVRVTVEVQPSKASLSDEPVLTLTIDSEEGVAVEKPPFGSTLGGFTIRNFREPLPKISNGREVIQQIYTLEPTETGRLRIDPISVAFTDRRPNGDGRRHSVETEPLSIEVTSLVGDKSPVAGRVAAAGRPDRASVARCRVGSGALQPSRRSPWPPGGGYRVADAEKRRSLPWFSRPNNSPTWSWTSWSPRAWPSATSSSFTSN